MKQSKKYIIGIDAGASNTEVALTPFPCKWESLKHFQIKKHPPINYNILGHLSTLRKLTEIIKKTAKNILIENIESIVIGIAGARNKADRDGIKGELKKKFKIKNIEILPDTEIALASIFDKNEKNCGILIAGTGSILYYRDSKGKINRVGGWGRYIGDEGSGYWIGKEALNRLTKFFDGLKSETNLDKVIKKHLSIDSLNLIKKIYHENFDLSKISKYVFMSAEKGDKMSNEIIKEAAEHLAKHFVVLKKIKMKIGLQGSLFTEEKLLEKYFRNIVKKKYPNIQLINSGYKPVWGAVKIGMESYQI